MKRSEMIEHIQAELTEYLNSYDMSTVARKKHLMRHASDGILAMLEGFGMLPPTALKPTNNYNGIGHVMKCPDNFKATDPVGEYVGAIKINEWEKE